MADPITQEQVAELQTLLSVMSGSDPNMFTDDPGGNDCEDCGTVFIGGPGHSRCAHCSAQRRLLAVMATHGPALLAELSRLRGVEGRGIQVNCNNGYPCGGDPSGFCTGTCRKSLSPAGVGDSQC